MHYSGFSVTCLCHLERHGVATDVLCSAHEFSDTSLSSERDKLSRKGKDNCKF